MSGAEDGGGNGEVICEEQHPLPPEIEGLTEDDTVCRFCGVSYLIRREVKSLKEKMLAMEKHLEDCREAAERGFAWRDERDQLAAKVKAMNENTAGAAQQLEQLRTALFRWGALQRPELQRHKASLAAVKRSVLLWQEDSQAAIGSARQQLAAVVRAAQASRAAAEGAKDELAVVQDELRDTTAALVAREAELAAARRDASAAQARAADKMAQQQAMAAEEAARLQSQLDTAHQHLASAVAEDKQRKEEAARLSARLKAVEDEKAGAAKQLQAAQSAAERQGSDMAQLRKELESCRKDLDETLAALEAARATHTSLTAAADSKDVQLSELQTELRAISLAAKGAASRKDEELAALRKQLEQAAAEHRASIDQAAGDREAAVRAVQAELESAHAQLAGKDTRLVEIERDLREAQTTAARRAQELQAACREAAQSVTESERRAEEALAKVDVLHKKNSELHRQVQSAEARQDQSSEIERLKALLHKREEEIEFLQETVARECSERQELIAALERAREEALGRHLQAAPNSAPLPRRSMAGGPLPKMPSRPPSSASSLGSSATPRSSLSASSVPSVPLQPIEGNHKPDAGPVSKEDAYVLARTQAQRKRSSASTASRRRR